MARGLGRSLKSLIVGLLFGLGPLHGSPVLAAQAARQSRIVTVVPAAALHPTGEQRAMARARRMEFVRYALERGMIATSHADSLTVLTMAVDTAWALVQSGPDDPDARYLYAVAVGQRLELSGTMEKIRLGAISRSEAEAALELDSDHAGAHHVLGRLNAATMRMSRVSRFVARRLLGATALEGVSWERAEHHFTRARDLEPSNPRHWMELGVLYADRDREDEAMVMLRHAVELERSCVADSLAIERASRVMVSLDCPRCSG